MKLSYDALKFIIVQVAPFAGAWIETVIECHISESSDVAPFAGAWIETD